MLGDELVVYPYGDVVISENNFELIEKIADVTIPVNYKTDKVVLNGESVVLGIYGMRSEDIRLLLDVKDGGYLSHGSSNCLVGSWIAEHYDLKVGQKVEIGDKRVKIAGIPEERGIGFDINPDYSIIITDRLYSALYDPDGYNPVIVKVEDTEDLGEVKSKIEDRLNRKETVVSVMEVKMITESFQALFSMISMFLMGIGSISLIVAGVSILNVMMMSTVERTKEIGVMRAIGTSKRGILHMFLFESLILGACGGVIGALLGFGGGYIFDVLMLHEASYLFASSNIFYILLGIAFGIGTSVLSGLYPAWRASKLKPIEALRYE
jgi:putative ABC transport system permease protein